MAGKNLLWKKGRGKLGALQPLLGYWEAQSESPVGKMKCTRNFELTLDGKYIKLTSRWEMSKGAYEELALFGIQDDTITFWSFTSDGKNSKGQLADGTDVHPEAISFEANMPAGLARMIYWPNEDGSFSWAVESKTKKGWNRFVEHKYYPVKK